MGTIFGLFFVQKEEALLKLEADVNYRRYPYKHYESVFTRFYQGYILPKKFNIDKRKLHLSNLVLTDQISRTEALDLLQQEPYPSSDQLNLDYNFVLKKFGLSKNEFEEYLVQPRVEHSSFPNSQKTWDWLKKVYFSSIKK